MKDKNLLEIKNIPKLTKKDEDYINARGFEIVKREPAYLDSFPYLKLTSPQENGGLKYYHANSCGAHPLTKMHPSVFTINSLVNTIEKLVAEDSIHDGKDGLFQTTPGTPIKIFVTDKKWLLVAKELVKKYKNN